MTGNEKLLKILNAIQEARKASVNPFLVNLYITKADDLDEFDPNEIYDILYKIEHQEKVLEIENVPSIVDPGSYIFSLPQTYFSIKLLDNFDKWCKRFYPEKKSTELINFNNITGELTINNKSVFLQKEAFRTALIALLMKEGKNRNKVWIWDEIIGKIQDTEDSNVLMENKKRFYPACDGLQKLISHKIGINDFLIFNNSTVQINPKYLKTSSLK